MVLNVVRNIWSVREEGELIQRLSMYSVDLCGFYAWTLSLLHHAFSLYLRPVDVISLT